MPLNFQLSDTLGDDASLNSAIYYIGLSLLTTHELDAVRGTEWKLLYILRGLSDASAFTWFVAVHMPAFFLLLWFSHHSNFRIRNWFRIAVSSFFVIHAALHFRLSADPSYGFVGMLSNVLIFGCGLAGIVLILRSFQKRTQNDL